MGRSERLFSYVGLEERIPANHPLCAIRVLTDEALAGLSQDFNQIYSREGRPSIPPERLLRRCFCNRSIPWARSGS